jgi:CheY-like chemotaxis protein
VWDTGPGIAPGQQQEIFSEFTQLAPLGQDRDGGLGLGLAIVDRLCGLLGHRLALRSRLGNGSCFSIEVPAAAPVSLAVLPPSRDLPAGKIVAVIEDDPLVLEGMGSLMRSWGCGVVTASSADEAIARLATLGRPDLIISDYRLPDRMTGIAAIARLRAVYKLPVAAFLISADTAPERLRDAQASGLHLLHKPVRPMALRAMVTQLLQGEATV